MVGMPVIRNYRDKESADILQVSQINTGVYDEDVTGSAIQPGGLWQPTKANASQVRRQPSAYAHHLSVLLSTCATWRKHKCTEPRPSLIIRERSVKHRWMRMEPGYALSGGQRASA